jgi:hypothetical protein
LYNDQLSKDLSVNDILNMVHWARLYEISGLSKKCSQLLVDKIDAFNCTEVYVKTSVFEDFDARKVAFECMKE